MKGKQEKQETKRTSKVWTYGKIFGTLRILIFGEKNENIRQYKIVCERKSLKLDKTSFDKTGP